jgi:iron complex transport system permease protein
MATMIAGSAGRVPRGPKGGAKLLAFFLFFAAASAFTGLLFGSVHIPADTVAHALLSSSDGNDNVAHQIVRELRLPRVLAAFACGGLLALAGVLLQVLLRNPLADPYILGVSGGAAVGALLAMLLGWGLVLTNLSSLAGALTSVAIVFGLSFRAGGWNLYRLLLTGVVLSAGWGALTTLILTLAPASDVKGMLFWLMGDVSRAEEVLPAWVTLCVITAASMLFSRSLNVLGLGQLKAQTLGVAVLPLQVGIYFCASLATVAALMLAGAIGFVGLIVPHAVRLLGVNDFRWLLPLSILLGGSFLTLADTLARTLWAPQQLPVGVLTALLGVPMLLLLLSRKP